MLHAPCVNKPPPGCNGCCPHTILAHPVGVLVGKRGGVEEMGIPNSLSSNPGGTSLNQDKITASSKLIYKVTCCTLKQIRNLARPGQGPAFARYMLIGS